MRRNIAPSDLSLHYFELMTLDEVLLSSLPTLAALILGIVLVKKSGVFEQRAHRKRVEDLLERIAVAVESSSKS